MVNMHSINLIASSPQVRSGRAYIVGTTVTVADVAVAMIYHRQDPDGIADWYGLSLPQIYAALAYYYDHKSDIDEQVQAQIRKARELKEQELATKVRFYLDENVQIALVEQLKRRGISVVTVRDLGLLGDEDSNHLERAAASGIEHAGIVFGQQEKHTIGDWVRFLELVHGVYNADEMVSLVEYL